MAEGEVLTGKVVLVGLLFCDEKGKVLNQQQRHGRIASIRQRGVVLTQSSGEEFVFPPDLSVLQEAPPGSFREASSGESIESPDFIANWYLFRKPGESESWVWRPGPYSSVDRNARA